MAETVSLDYLKELRNVGGPVGCGAAFFPVNR